jgi:hypothetical protein
MVRISAVRFALGNREDNFRHSADYTTIALYAHPSL